MKYTFFNALAALENGKRLPLQQETKPYGSSGFPSQHPICNCGHSSLMERDSKLSIPQEIGTTSYNGSSKLAALRDLQLLRT
jgi:hypothetical protein